MARTQLSPSLRSVELLLAQKEYNMQFHGSLWLTLIAPQLRETAELYPIGDRRLPKRYKQAKQIKRMDWKEFLKPTRSKLIIFLIIAVLVNIPGVGYYKDGCYSNVEEFQTFECTRTIPFLIPPVVHPYFEGFHNPVISILGEIQEQTLSFCHARSAYWYFSCFLSIFLLILGLLLILFYWYILACMIVFTYNKVKYKK